MVLSTLLFDDTWLCGLLIFLEALLDYLVYGALALRGVTFADFWIALLWAGEATPEVSFWAERVIIWRMGVDKVVKFW